MSTETAPKTITLGDWLKGMTRMVAGLGANGFYAAAEVGPTTYIGEGPTPEDALQELAETVCGPGTLLDLGRSAKWAAAHGPDGVAGLSEGECGVVEVKDGALRLMETLGTPEYHTEGDQLIVEYRKAPNDTAGLAEGEWGVVVCREGKLLLDDKITPEIMERIGPFFSRRVRDNDTPTARAPNTCETGLPVVYPDPPAETRTENLQRRVDEHIAAHPEVLGNAHDGKVTISLPSEGPADRLAEAIIGLAERCHATKTAPSLDTDVERGGIRDTLNRVSAWAAEHMGEGTVLQHHTANGILLQLQHGGRTFPDAQIYYDLKRLTPGDFSRQVDEMLAAWEKLLKGMKEEDHE